MAPNSVFVGNIPYDATEEQLKEVFSAVGEIVSFRLVFDRDTGKPKGFGFCEYKDAATAASAMRNLNNKEFSGRNLRVDNADDKDNYGGGGHRSGPSAGGQKRTSGPQGQRSGVPTRPGGQQVAPPPATGITDVPPPIYGAPVAPGKAQESVANTIDKYPPQKMYEIMKELKLLIVQQPDQARGVLEKNPQLCYALLQAQLRMNMIDPKVAETMYEKAPPVPKDVGGGPAPRPQPSVAAVVGGGPAKPRGGPPPRGGPGPVGGPGANPPPRGAGPPGGGGVAHGAPPPGFNNMGPPRHMGRGPPPSGRPPPNGPPPVGGGGAPPFDDYRRGPPPGRGGPGGPGGAYRGPPGGPGGPGPGQGMAPPQGQPRRGGPGVPPGRGGPPPGGVPGGAPPPQHAGGKPNVPLAEAIRTVMSLTEAQIQSLPPEKAKQLMALKREFLAKQQQQGLNN